jgi:hypothetical protein
MGFNQVGDGRQDLVQGCADEDHLERIEHRFSRQGFREDRRLSRRLALQE